VTERPDLLETAVRAFTLRESQPIENRRETSAVRGQRRGPWRSRWREALIWDTETVTTPDQRLLILCWRLYLIEEGHSPRCLEEGMAYPDDLAVWNREGLATVTGFVAANPRGSVTPGLGRMGGAPTLRCEPLSWWLDRRLFRHGYAHRERCEIVGLNLLFDLGRLAGYWAPAEDDYFGGWSLGIWGSFDRDGRWQDQARHPRLRAKAVDPRRTLIAWGSIGKTPDYWKGRGRFVDLRTLVFALTDKGHSLETACAAFGVPYQKRQVSHGILSPELLSYAQEDVEATANLYFACLDELSRHEGVDLEPHRLFSPATVGARYLDAMGYRRPLEKFTNLDFDQLGWTILPETVRAERRVTVFENPKPDALSPELFGWAMSAFFGGRAEARIVRTPIPVTLVDFTSMYPSVNALLDTRLILAADRVQVLDVTSDVRALIERSDLAEWCLKPASWKRIGVTLVEVNPNGAVLPIRARYDPASDDHGIGVNPFHFDGSVWYALPDVLAAVLLGEICPEVLRAVKIVGEGIQQGLRAVRLRGGRQLDPSKEDPFVAMIEERHRVRNDPSLGDEERQRRELFLKVTANSTSYGVLARFDRRERSTPTTVTVHGPDGEPFQAKTAAPEDPGPYCFPPVAATITAAARLMLALLEHAVTIAGGTYAFCDTDSLAIVATRNGGPIEYAAADGPRKITALAAPAVADILARFTPLNCYDPALVPGSPWSVKHDSLNRPLHCYAISAKRYALYREDKGNRQFVSIVDEPEGVGDGDEAIAEREADEYVDWSEHGLGLYLDPTATDAPTRDDSGRRIWVKQGWDWLLKDAHGDTPALPEWCHRYALTRFTISGPRTAAWFDGYNEGRPRSQQLRPGSFGLIGHPEPGFTAGALPAAPYESDPNNWPRLRWFDRRTGRPTAVTTVEASEELAGPDLDGTTPIQTIGAILRRYRLRPEYKSLAPDGSPASRRASGLLKRRPVESTLSLQDLTGKESNRLLERMSGEIANPDQYRTDYASRHDRWATVVLAVRALGTRDVAHRAGVARRTLQRIIQSDRPSVSHRANQVRIAQAVAMTAAESIKALGETPPTGIYPTITRYLQLLESGQHNRLCECGCGRILGPRQRRWRTDACRLRARRVRQAAQRRSSQSVATSGP
jgi:hypothetical protein